MKARKDLSVLIIPLVALILVSELSLIAVTLNNQNASSRQRDRNRETVLTVLRESYSNKCLLLIPNLQRTEENVKKCDQEAKAKVEVIKNNSEQ